MIIRKHVFPALLACICALCAVLALCGCALTQQVAPDAAIAATASPSSSDVAAGDSEPQAATDAPEFSSDPDGYTLAQVVVLSRHGIRAPLSTTGSALDTATPHTWIDWTANASELTVRGGTLETMMGSYMRRWLESEGLIPQNYRPESDEVRFYANAKQRTIATAQYFSSGMLPVANVTIETHADYDTMDPVFSPVFTFVSDDYRAAVLEQIAAMGQGSGTEDVAVGLQDSYALIEEVVDYTESDAYRAGELADLTTNDSVFSIELGAEPAVAGSLKTACQLADALVLQYYETPDATAAAFGHQLTQDQWSLISRSKDFYGDVLFTAPLVAANVAHPLLQEIAAELDTEGRIFTFLCGHDSNVCSVLAALGVEDYELPGAIESATPIGVKLVFERWVDAEGNEFGRVRLLYMSVEQLRSGSMLAGTEAPMSVELSFAGLEKNEDGLYDYGELRAHIDAAIARYDQIVDEYSQDELPQAA